MLIPSARKRTSPDIHFVTPDRIDESVVLTRSREKLYLTQRSESSGVKLTHKNKNNIWTDTSGMEWNAHKAAQLPTIHSRG